MAINIMKILDILDKIYHLLVRYFEKGDNNE